MKHIAFVGFTDKKFVEIIKYMDMSFGPYNSKTTNIVVIKDGYKRETKVVKQAKENNTRIMDRSYFIKLYIPEYLMTLYEKCKHFDFASEPNDDDKGQMFFGNTRIMNQSNIINNRAFLQYRNIYVNDILEKMIPDAEHRNLLYMPDKDLFVALDYDKKHIYEVTASFSSKKKLLKEKKEHPVSKDPKNELNKLLQVLRKNAVIIY